ncbi:AzlD domain-containing protein [Roseicitreum antarcticum]|uniref:Branched-chain amino acid transport protein (AzlD) n=1 Tax=Roseicitreum antarcticum TaxID=564137 RepID=A0A1H3AIW3_9RHOB|nr:AzlD domain-containing protein [Roseicitreum antarcticum]SDX29535.1 Branched-chain amino acid transport protein (AzlD) [Roseicitreum antarcticum]
MTELVQVFGPNWPFLALLLLGFVPNEIWRVAAALLVRRIDEHSKFFVLVRLISTSLVAAVVAKLLLQPPPALALIPVWGRAGALGLAVLVFFIAGRSMLWAICSGVVVTIVAAAGFSA